MVPFIFSAFIKYQYHVPLTILVVWYGTGTRNNLASHWANNYLFADYAMLKLNLTVKFGSILTLSDNTLLSDHFGLIEAQFCDGQKYHKLKCVLVILLILMILWKSDEAIFARNTLQN